MFLHAPMKSEALKEDPDGKTVCMQPAMPTLQGLVSAGSGAP